MEEEPSRRAPRREHQGESPKPLHLPSATPAPPECSQITSEWGPVSHGSFPPTKTSRHSPSHLHQDTLVAGLGCDFVPSHTRVAASDRDHGATVFQP